jgi:V8-like Glu-specific endopeptidase
MRNLNENMADPLSSDNISKLRSLRTKDKPPAKLVLNMDTFSLPAGGKASLVKVRGASNTFKVRVSIPGKTIGQRAQFQKIPVESPKTKKLKKSKTFRKVDDGGMRPPHLAVNFVPKKIELKPNERSQPPFDFDYKRNGEILGRPGHVFPPDDRYIYQDTNFPWNTVGRVDTPLGWCTGCTIGSRLLLTGNHCIQWNSDNTAGWVRFRPAYYNGSAPFGEAWANRVIHWIKTTPADALMDQETAFDYVVCVMDTRIGDIVGYSGYRTYEPRWNGGSYWQHMGYPTDLSGGERPSLQHSAVISSVETQSAVGQEGYVLGHFNDVVNGHSGGPVWGWWTDEAWPRIVGVFSTLPYIPSMDTSGDNEFGGGPALSSLISWARSNYP